MAAPVAPVQGTAVAAPTTFPEDEGSSCCGCMFKITNIPQITKKVGIVSLILHIVGFFIGHVPFFVVNFQGPEPCIESSCANDNWRTSWCQHDPRNYSDNGYCASEAACRSDNSVVLSCNNSGVQGFLTFVAIPTIIIWLVGAIASILMLPGVCGAGCETSCRMCAVTGLSITTASLHGIIGFVEAIIFWVSGLLGNGDWVAGLLLIKNLLCLGSEITLAVVACGVSNALNVKAARSRQQQTQMANMEMQLQMQQMQAQMLQMQAAAGTAPVVGQPAMPMAGTAGPSQQGVPIAAQVQPATGDKSLA